MRGLGVLVLGAPEQRVERAHLDADPAVHAEPVVDVEAVEDVDAARPAAFATRRALAPCGPRCRCTSRGSCRPQSMQTVQFSSLSAMTPRAWRRVLPLVGVLHRDRALHHRAEGHAETADDAGQLRLLERHQTATLMMAVAMMFSSADRDQELPRERLQLVLPQARVGEPHPEHQERDRHQLHEQHDRSEQVGHARRGPRGSPSRRGRAWRPAPRTRTRCRTRR